jgi:fructoselysine 3-epimerase
MVTLDDTRIRRTAMKPAFSTNAFTRHSLVDAIEAIAAAGYAGVEILADEPHAYPARIDDALTGRVVDVLNRNGMQVSNVNVNCTFGYWADAPAEPFFEPSLISPVARRRQDRIELIGRAMTFASRVGAKNVSITSGRMTGDMHPDAARSQLIESLKPILEQAERLRIDVGIECEPGLFLEYVDELVEWISLMKSDRLGANLDVGHCQVIGESIPDSVRKLGGRIWNLHVEGMPGRKHYHLVPGAVGDTLDWTGLRRSLASVGYDRFVTVELYTMTHRPHEAAAESIAFLRNWVAG